jgi:hypothetical protein
MAVGKHRVSGVCFHHTYLDWVFSTVGAAYGVLFTENESAFSNFRLWESLGYVIAYVYTPRIRIKYAQIILLCVLTLSMICYGVIDFTESRRKKQENKAEPAVTKDEVVPDAATSL